MKTLLLVRHAKSSWADAGTPDFERPLSGRGKKDAVEMARRIRDAGTVIDGFVSSPARRARKTAAIFLKEFGRDKEELMLAERLYEARPEHYAPVIESFPDALETIAIFAHNPGISDFINSLGLTKPVDMPTCGIYACRAHTDSWSEFIASPKTFLFFESPKSDDSAG